jgi:hypothetical protein
MIVYPLVSVWYPAPLVSLNNTLSPAETLCPRGDLNSEGTGVTEVPRHTRIAALTWRSG